MTDVIEVGNKIDITKIEDGVNTKKLTDNEKTVYKSEVYDILDDDEIQIAMPFEGTKLVLLQLDEQYNMCFYSKKGLFQCVGQIVDRFKSENKFMLIVVLKTGLKKVQRREYFRIEHMLDIEYRCLAEHEQNAASMEEILLKEQMADVAPDYIRGVAVDVSGGGVRFVSAIKHEKSDYLIIKMGIVVGANAVPLHIIGKIVSSEKKQDEIRQFETRVQFVQIEQLEREKLIQYIFEVERKIMKREKS